MLSAQISADSCPQQVAQSHAGAVGLEVSLRYVRERRLLEVELAH